MLSEWVKNEAGEGAERGILIPVLIDEVKIPFAFKRIQAAKLINLQRMSETQEFIILCQTIKEIIGSPEREKQINSDYVRQDQEQAESNAREVKSQEKTLSSATSNHRNSKATRLSLLVVIISDVVHTLLRHRVLTTLFLATLLGISGIFYLYLDKHEQGKESLEDPSVAIPLPVPPKIEDRSVDANRVGLSPSSAREGSAEAASTAKSLDQQLEGTRWEFNESFGHRHLYEFLPGGKIRFKCLTTKGDPPLDEIWTVIGDQIILKDRKGEAVREGRMTGDRMRGTGRNDKGGKWTWTAFKRTR